MTASVPYSQDQYSLTTQKDTFLKLSLETMTFAEQSGGVLYTAVVLLSQAIPVGELVFLYRGL